MCSSDLVRSRELRFETEYDGPPALTAGGKAECALLICNLSGEAISGRLALKAMKELALEYRPECTIPAGGSARIPIRVRHLHPDRITDALTVEAEFRGTRYVFGFAAATPWRAYGPYWGNFSTVPQVDLEGGRYQDFVSTHGFPNHSTAIRNYHLNMRAGLDIAAPDEAALVAGTTDSPPHALIQALDDLIPVDGAFGFQGPAVFYLVSEFATKEAMTITISIGRSCPLVFFLDGKEMARADFETCRTPENINLNAFDLPAGRHRAVFKIARQGEQAKLSINYKTGFRPGERIDAHIVGLEFFN